MNETLSQPTTERIFRRLEEPMQLFGQELPPWVWGAALALVLIVGFFYVGWMYVKDSRTIGVWWASLLGLLRTAVYVILALVFLLPAEQTWYETKQRSKVVLLFDVSPSITQTRDGTPQPGESFEDLATRQKEVMDFLGDKNINFLDRILKTNPVTGYRFARQLDPEYRYFEGGKFWPRALREKALSAPSRGEQPPAGLAIAPEHWQSWLTAMVAAGTPKDWQDKEARTEEFRRQLKANELQVEQRFFDGTAVGESLLEVIKQERNNMLQGIVVFTDGRSTQGSVQSVRDAVAAANLAEIPIFVVAVGQDRPRPAIEVVDVRVPPLIRPEDKFPLAVSVNGEDLPNEEFQIFVDVTRIKRDPDGKTVNVPIELVEIDEKGQIVKDSKIVISQNDPSKDPPQAKPITLDATYAKEKPKFQPGNPPNAQIRFELDAASLAKAAGKPIDEQTRLVDGKKYGIAPDDNSELRFRVRVPKHKDEITNEAEHVSEPADMRVQEKPLRVLLFASAATREYQFLRTLFVREKDKGRADIFIHLQPFEGEEPKTGIVQDVDPSHLLKYFPNKLRAAPGDTDPYSSLSSFDVIIAFDVNWRLLSKEQLRLVQLWVEGGGGLIVVGGELHTVELARPLGQNDTVETQPSLYIRDILPVVLDDPRRGEIKTDKPRRLKFLQVNLEDEFMRLDDADPKAQWKAGWDRFFNEVLDEDGNATAVAANGPPERGFFSYFPSRAVKQSARVLAALDDETVRMQGTEKPMPFLAVQRRGSGKVYWVASGEMWRLRTFRDAYHERFWTKLAREAGSQSVNTLNRRITPVMSTRGVVNKYQTFEARFVDLVGEPIRNDIKDPPVMQVTLPQGAAPHKGDTVVIHEGPHAGKQGKVAEITTTKDGEGNGVTQVRVVGVEGAGADETVLLPVAQVEIVVPPIKFRPRLGTAADRNKENDGWFKVEFQPKVDGEYKIRVEYPDTPDNVYNHKFIVKDSNPELDNVRPNVSVLYEMASDAAKVLARIPDAEAKARVRGVLKRPDIKEEQPVAGAPVAEPGKENTAAAQDRAGQLKLYFDLQTAQNIPLCMVEARKEIKNRGKVDDLWDDGFVVWSDPSGEKDPVKISYVLCLIVGLLSIEWLTRKLLRLA